MLWKFPKTMSNFSDLPSNKKIQYNYLFIFFWEQQGVWMCPHHAYIWIQFDNLTMSDQTLAK